MAYWQNGKVYVHTGTQSTAQTVPAIARWLNIDVAKVRPHQRIHRGGFGSKGTAGRVAGYSGALVEEGQRTGDDADQPRGGDLIGRARPSLLGRMKAGFSKDGPDRRLDMFVISNNGPYDAQGDVPTSGRIVSLLYQTQAMRWRGATVADEHAA